VIEIMPNAYGESPASSPSLARLEKLQGFLEHDPDNLSLLAEIADTAISCGELETARAMAQRGLERVPGDPYFSLRLSSVALAEGNHEEAGEITGSLLQQGHGDAAVRYNHAHALIGRGRFEEAQEMLSRLYAEGAPFPQIPQLLIRALHYLGEVEEAIAIAQSYLENHPDAGDVAGMLSLLHFDNDDLAAAEHWSRQALAQAPNNLDALLAGAGVALAAEDAPSARTLLHRAVSLSPTNGRAWSKLALADLLDLDLVSAREKLAYAVKYMPEHIGTWHILGWVQLMQQDIDGAETSFCRALALDDNFGETHGGLSAIAAMRGDWVSAEDHAKIARRLAPEAMSAHYMQIIRLQQEGKTDTAFRMMEIALKRGHAPSGGNLSEMLRRIASKRRIPRR